MWTSEAEVLPWWQACHQELVDKWGEDGLKKFNTTQAARDIGLVIDKLQKPGAKKYVYGVSYGTFWAQRYLQVRPEQPDGVVLDSVVDPTAYVVSHQDQSFDVGARLLAEACKTNATCTSHYGDDPWAKISEHVAKVKASTCADAPKGELVLQQAIAMLQNTELMPLLLPLLHRYARCSPGDVAALKRVDEVFRGFVQSPRFSQATFFNIALAEMFERPIPSEEEMRARAAAVVFPANVWNIMPILAFWTTYTDAFIGTIPKTTKPVLLLNGTLDVQTLHAQAAHVAESFTAPGQQFVSIPNGNHSLMQQSMTADRDQPSCGQDIVVSWLKTGKADTSCIPRVVGVTFTPDPGLVNHFFGRSDLWNEPTSGAASDRGPLPPHVARMIDDVARRIGERPTVRIQ